MTVIIVVSSPRKNGFGDIFAQKVKSGAESIGKEVKTYYLNQMRNFRQCQSCDKCKDNGGKCILNDDISPLIEDIRDAEAIVNITSIEFNEANGMFTLAFDRLYCFLDREAATIMPKGKKVATIVTASADQSSADRVAENYEKIMSQHFFCEPVGRIGYCTWMMPAGEFLDESILTEAEEIGKRL